MKFGQSIEDSKRYIFLEKSNKRWGRQNGSRPLNFYGSKLLQRNKKHFSSFSKEMQRPKIVFDLIVRLQITTDVDKIKKSVQCSIIFSTFFQKMWLLLSGCGLFLKKKLFFSKMKLPAYAQLSGNVSLYRFLFYELILPHNVSQV